MKLVAKGAWLLEREEHRTVGVDMKLESAERVVMSVSPLRMVAVSEPPVELNSTELHMGNAVCTK
jgi:hypothetical protein